MIVFVYFIYIFKKKSGIESETPDQNVVFVYFIYIFKKKSGIETPDQNGQWFQHLLTLFAILYESNTEGSNFRIIFVCFYVYILCMFCIVFNLCRI